MKFNVSIIIIFFTFFSKIELANSKNLSAGWELWYPYQYHNKQQQLVGLDIETFDAILTKAGLAYDIIELPWKRHLHFIKTGEMDIAMGASITAEREEFAYFSIPYRQETVKLFVRKGNAKNIKLNKLADLIGSPYMIGVEGGYYYGEEYQALIKKLDFQAQISEVIDIEQNVSMLLKGHLDGFLVDPITMKAFIEKYQMQNEFEAHSLEIYSDNIAIMLSKASSNQETLNKINAAIEALKQDGTIDKIIDDWTTINESNN